MLPDDIRFLRRLLAERDPQTRENQPGLNEMLREAEIDRERKAAREREEQKEREMLWGEWRESSDSC